MNTAKKNSSRSAFNGRNPHYTKSHKEWKQKLKPAILPQKKHLDRSFSKLQIQQ